MPNSFTVGDVRIDRVVELDMPFIDAFQFLPTLTPEILEANRHWLEPTALEPGTGKLIFPMHSWVLRIGKTTILIDSCVGNHKNRPTRSSWHLKTDTTYMDGLARVGLSVEDVDYVMCTHLHPDHVGWNTRLLDGRWVPTFPNARYVFAKQELAYWQAENAKEARPHIVDSVLPIVAAGRVMEVASDQDFAHGITLLPTPGHTPDHYALHLASAGRAAVFTGDLIHSPIQCRHPELSSFPDVDKPLAAATRRAFMDRYCETDTLVCTAHFPSPSVGHFHRHGDAFDFRGVPG